MRRNWGLPPKEGALAFRNAKEAKPILTLIVTTFFGIFGVATSAISFNSARETISQLFHGGSLIAAVAAAGFGCWLYVWIARPRFAAQFTIRGDAFSGLLRFYAKATIILFVSLMIGQYSGLVLPGIVSVFILCLTGGAAAAAAFQTVLVFVPHYE